MTAAQPKITKKQAAILQTPSGFSKGVLGHSVWGMQRDIMESVAVNRRTAVKSCHASGKTFLSADVVLWWITTFPDAIAITTAPTWIQVEELLWGEIRRSAANARIQYPASNVTKLELADGNYAIGLSTNDSDKFQGFHAPRVLIVLDEAPGVRPEIWSGLQGLRAGGRVHILAIGNPVEPSGEFYNAFTSSRALWKGFTISAFDTPNLAHTFLEYERENEKGEMETVRLGSRGHAAKDILAMDEDALDEAVRPYLVTRRWVKEMFVEWGPEHPYFLSRALGEFPMETDDMLLPLSWLERLKVKSANTPNATKGKVRAGLDVAGPGEAETVLTLVRDERVFKMRSWLQADPRGEIVSALMPYKGELESVNVDSIGVGWGIYLHLCDEFGAKDRFGNGVVTAVNVGMPARDKKKFVNSKAEYFWNLRQIARAGDLLGVDDEKTIGQLATIKYKHNSRGLIEVESKDDLKKRGVKSPDRAESIMLAYARPKVATPGQFGSVTKSEGGGSGGDGFEKFGGESALTSRWGDSSFKGDGSGY